MGARAVGCGTKWQVPLFFSWRLPTNPAVLKQYEIALARLPTRLGDLQQSTSLSVEAFNPEADLKALIEGNRTGPFRPKPLVYESLETDVPEVNFGIDLRKWAGDQGWRTMVRTPSREKGAVPEVLEGLLAGLVQLYQDLPDEGMFLSLGVQDTADGIRPKKSLAL
jgi:hypothetical protein